MFIQSIFGLIFLLLINNINSSVIRNEKCSKSCFNGALCSIKNEIIQCYCLPEWDGDRCDIPREISTDYEFLDENQIIKTQDRNDPCLLIPKLCNDRGTCFLNETSNKLSCQCAYPYAGPRCNEFSVCNEYCDHDPGATCKVVGGEPKCNCTELYAGARCQSVKTTSSTTPPPTTADPRCNVVPDEYCNTGTCIIQNGQIACKCPPTYMGATCDTPIGGTPNPGPGPINPVVTNPSGLTGNACASNPCMNRPCYNTGNTYYCLPTGR